MPALRKTLTVIVPFLNERENLPLLWERLQRALASQPEALELLLVDDGSSDGSAAWALDAARRDPRVRLLQLSRNFGHQIAITAGIDHAAGDAVVIMDADLQDPPEVILDLLAKWREGYEVVFAVRRRREGETWTKRLFAAAFYRVFHMLTKVSMPMDAGDFRLVDRQVVNVLREMREQHRFVRGLACWAGYRQCPVYYDRQARHAGKTKYTVWESARLAWDAITCFSGAPLRWMMFAGFLVAAIGIAQAVRLLVWKLLHPDTMVPGWATVVCLILILGGMQLMCMGLLGQYVSRIFEEAKRRPLYCLREPAALNRPRPDGGDKSGGV